MYANFYSLSCLEHSSDWPSQNQQSVWDKPDALKTPQDKALDSTNWKQYESQGKHYYVHKSTQETTWDQPEEVAQALAALPSASNSPAPPAFVPQQNTNMAMQPGGGALVGMGFSGPAAPSSNPQQQQPVPYNMQPDYVLWSTNPQAAMQAFKDLLKQAGVNPQWTWEQTMRTIITAPAYKALKTGDERRAAFEDYQKELVETAKEKRKGRLAQLKPAWREALAQASEMGMKSWWPWTKTAQMLSTEFSEVWRMTRDDTDRKELWQDYVDELKAKESKREKEVQQRNVAKLNRLLDSVDLNEHSTWRDTRRTIERSKEFANDAELQQTLDPNDFLDLFEERLNKLESTLQEKRLKTREDKKRQVRKHREAFAGLLEDLREDKKIKSGTTWPDIWPHVKDDERLHNMLGNPGSSPLELFWDVVDELDERVEEHCRAIEGAFAQNKITIDLNTTWEQFQEHLQSEAVQPKVRNVDQEAREGAFNMVSRSVLDDMAV